MGDWGAVSIPVEEAVRKASNRVMMNGWRSLLRMHTSLRTRLASSGLLNMSGMRLSATCRVTMSSDAA